MNPALITNLKSKLKGEVLSDDQTLNQYSHDASIFEVKPQVIVFPKDADDVKSLVKFVRENKTSEPNLSLTARSAGTDMGGGPLNDSIIVEFTKYFNKITSVDRKPPAGGQATAQPGVFYRDFEKETLKHDLIFPPFPSSREICAIGGIINNNAGGEKSLKHGKTEDYVKVLKIILSDGNEYLIKALNENELMDKLKQNDFEGEIYKKMYKLINDNYELLTLAKPQVSKNSAGYYLWNIYDKKTKTFDLTKLFTGSQGTLGIMTEVTLRLTPVEKHSELVTIFLKDLENLGEIVDRILPLSPESLETYDDNTLKIALKYFYSFASMLGAKNILSTFWDFLPEFKMLITGGVPKLVVLVEFTEKNHEIIDAKVEKLTQSLKDFKLKMRVIHSEKEEKKYWLIRRQSFELLRQKIHNKHTAPFIDDFVVNPMVLPEFLPKLEKILDKYPQIIYTIAGHLGNGNFHIIPLMNLEDPKVREIIPALGKEVYDLVLEYKGSTTGEHNDGLVRSSYLPQMYGEKVYSLFQEVKDIFDPLNIFNPRKKVGATMDYAMEHVRTKF